MELADAVISGEVTTIERKNAASRANLPDLLSFMSRGYFNRISLSELRL
jgi:hypothetical protein